MIVKLKVDIVRRQKLINIDLIPYFRFNMLVYLFDTNFK
jgi:hypothetical protein